jgi:hypothetical protein
VRKTAAKPGSARNKGLPRRTKVVYGGAVRQCDGDLRAIRSDFMSAPPARRVVIFIFKSVVLGSRNEGAQGCALRRHLPRRFTRFEARPGPDR